MLSPLKLTGVILFWGVILIPSVKGESCSQAQDLSWVKKLNGHTQSLSDASHKDSPLEEALLEGAESIVHNALKSASSAKTCSQAKELAQFGEEAVRQTLKSSEGNINNSHSKELSDSRVDDSRVTETGVSDTLPYPKLLVFVSFSMPPETLKALSTQVSRVGGKLVLRGLVDGSFQTTAQKLKELQLDVMIDPTLFEAYNVTRCPTFILRNSSTEQAEEDLKHDRMTGNVSLDYVLEKFSSMETQHDAFEMLETLRRKP